ncbi:MAG TPA: DNA recombination/repair protein RecA, partial [Clostridiales bacterium]|nr:DNA recombination/repair protein RecA [Clostridiales bacterium]
IIKKSGAWFQYDADHRWQGRDNAKAYLRENRDFADKIAAQIMENKELLLNPPKSGKKLSKLSEPANDVDEPAEPASKQVDLDIEVED